MCVRVTGREDVRVNMRVIVCDRGCEQHGGRWGPCIWGGHVHVRHGVCLRECDSVQGHAGVLGGCGSLEGDKSRGEGVFVPETWLPSSPQSWAEAKFVGAQRVRQKTGF